MSVSIKTEEEIRKMRVAGKLASEVLDMIETHVQPGISTDELNTICHDYITCKLNAIPAPLNYRGFPKSICTSVNNVVCHGIPGDRVLKKGDIINIDITVIKDGYHGDTSRMFPVSTLVRCWDDHNVVLADLHEKLGLCRDRSSPARQSSRFVQRVAVSHDRHRPVDCQV